MKENKRSLDPDELRRRAEEALHEGKSSPPPPPARDDPQKLLHELQVHQVELEMQNEELRQARDEAEAALEKYTDLYDLAPVGYATLDGAGIIRSINLTAAALLGKERSLLIGRSFAPFVAARSSLNAFLDRAIASQGKEACELTLVDNGREPRIVRMEAMACTSGQECRVAILDITERKRIEEEVQSLHKKLERRAYELEVANQELEAFSYTVSHDLRSPLTVIGGYCQMIQKVYGERLGEECSGYLHEIDKGIHRMSGLVETLLRFSSLTRSELQSAPVDLSEIAQDVAGELVKQQPERRVTFTIAPGVTTHGDPKLLRIALENILGNAWKYTSQKEDAVIEFGAEEEAGQRVCFVRDNGPGFDNAHAELLFRAFYRFPGDQESSGFGIGLATVQRIIEFHGGRAWAEGKLGVGATFYFTLPS
jgi:PAS domain S-box-containing protein